MRFTGSTRPRSAQTANGSRARAARGVVVSYAPPEGFNPESHECVTRMQIAEKLAALKGYEFAGEYDGAIDYADAVYFVPSCTLVADNAADQLGIQSEHDLFGGVVPYPFVGTKTITHPLVHDDACAPDGWSPRFAMSVKNAVLDGYAAFTMEDALHAGERLLERGNVRVKPALAVGGRGQCVVDRGSGLIAALEAIDRTELARYGVVVEQNLTDVTTYSVGQVRVGEQVATYVGTQDVTADNGGAEVYGGSALTVVRGDFDALLELDIGHEMTRAVMQAKRYDDAARLHFSGFFASRRNYDIAHGLDSDGGERCGVLEQSWRIGGASGAELAALEVFHSDANLRAVHARCVELYGVNRRAPADATVYFCGQDEKVGFIMKYTTVAAYADAG